jgi:hypothetical protein
MKIHAKPHQSIVCLAYLGIISGKTTVVDVWCSKAPKPWHHFSSYQKDRAKQNIFYWNLLSLKTLFEHDHFF